MARFPPVVIFFTTAIGIGASAIATPDGLRETHTAFGMTRNIGMPIIRSGYIDTIPNGLSTARNGG